MGTAAVGELWYAEERRDKYVAGVQVGIPRGEREKKGVLCREGRELGLI